jgi:multidrug efflux pump subunit AcrA (membrane-fusion protein)
MKWLKLALLVAVLAAAGVGVARLRTTQAATDLPTAKARQGEFLVLVKCRGELRAKRSLQVNAPMNVPDLRIIWLAQANSPIKQGDVVVRFDPSSANQQLKEKEAALKQAEETLNQAVAEARITADSDSRDLASARYDVERARLEVSRMAILSAIQGEEARINLGLAERKLKVQESTVALHDAGSRAKLASLTRVRDQALYEVNLTRERLQRMEVHSPQGGIIVYLPNYAQGWTNAKPFKVGDAVWPGATLAEIPDLATLEMEGKVDEIDRGRLSAGQDARIRLDSLPELTIPARLSGLSVMTQMSFDWPITFSFRAYAPLERPDARLRPDMNGSLDVIVKRIPNAISVPSRAVFTRAGRPIVYVAEGGQYRARAVEVLARNTDEVAVSGVNSGSTIALQEPSSPDKEKKKS